MNTSNGLYIQAWVYGIQNVMIVAFSIYFTVLFYDVLKRMRQESIVAGTDQTETVIKANAIVRSVTNKSIIHCVVICIIHLISLIDIGLVCGIFLLYPNATHLIYYQI
jgi:hypothetical protein